MTEGGGVGAGDGPASVALAGVAAAVDGLWAADLSAARTGELLDLLQGVERQYRRLAAVSVAVIGQIEARGLAAPAGQSSTAALVRQVITIGRDEAQRRARLAVGVCPSTGLSGAPVGPRFPLVGAAVADGGVGVREAALICSTITGFPARVGPELRDAAEVFLVEQARVLDPKTFKVTAREVGLMADPDGAPDDRDAQERMEFHLGQRREDGLTRCWGLLDDLTAEALRTAFGAMCSPSAERNRDRPDTAWPEDLADDGEGESAAEPTHTQPAGNGGNEPFTGSGGAGEDAAAQPFLPEPDAANASASYPVAEPGLSAESGVSAEGAGEGVDMSATPAVRSRSASRPAPAVPDEDSNASTRVNGENGGPPAGPGQPPTPTGSITGCGDGCGAADGRSPGAPADADPSATPVNATGAALGCPEPERGWAVPARPVWRAPRMPYAWAPLGSVPSDYPPPAPRGADDMPSVSGPSDGDPATAPATSPPAGTTPEPEPPPDRRTAGTKRAQALSVMITAFLDAGSAPTQGGERPHLLVTIDEQSLHERTRPARLGYGDRLPAGQLRMLACDAQIIPAVLGGPSEVLDVGRAMRTFTAACRKAILYRDGGCVFPGCSMPGKWAEFHHIRPWYDGGPSDLHNGCLLCRRHHTLIHQDQWHIRLGADRLPELIPPTSHDLEQRPLRNTLHRPPVLTWPQVG